ncbi:MULTISPECIES: PTS mannose/fructose/sorbose transporter subunit IIC [unclassified Actinomyces]|uniref:PTS mannose/fructose/sorbose transporter subunit IIC n=1 Tax=unclassified Actinomyces TaxID=2609248 RepID=UPI001373D04F|nr:MULTISPECIES: PTS mannose/fructose/sorbose transporter subunit IIC [unclassified Actinomyces]MBW3069225.1 PTS mannose/fructose/sorbose transporter subunit IIC [Actinomyces sp. 594]NDR54095.1 PTS mannose/fructose/sorbose transporter subunit IIC [Actinomyces sp. 565]QHO91979.1 PTS mannose/fructose/sorbose transporter subunit IIC [Actinomyces sp. 432]
MHDIGAVQIILVTLVAFLAGCDSVLDERMFYRPIVACTLTGLALGDPTTGIMVGGSLELVSLGWMNVGAAMAPDAALASTVSTVIAIAGGQSHEEAIAVAVPLAVAGQALTIFVRTVNVFFAHQADRFAEDGNMRGIQIMHFIALSLQGLRVAIPTAAVAVVASGDAVQRALGMIPDVVTQGLQIAGGFIVVVGYAMVINMMRARKLMPFFFIGFIVAQSMTTLDTGITLVALGIMGICLAFIYVQLNPDFHESVQLPRPAPVAAGAGGLDDDLDDDLDDELD